MPGFDRTGPVGAGPATGRGMGVCSGFRPAPYGYQRGFWGRGAGRRIGRGFGCWPANWWAGRQGFDYGQGRFDPVSEKTALQDHAENLKAELAEVEKHLADFDQSEE